MRKAYLDFVPFAKRFGFTSFGRKRRKGQNKCEMGRIRDLEKTAYYVSKYISKTMFGDVPFEKGMHLYYASRGLNKDALLAKGTLCASPDFMKQNIAFENEFCVKVFSEEPEPLMECVVPLGNRYKNGHNIPTLTPKAFIERYGFLSRAFGFNVHEFDVVAGSVKYRSFVDFLFEHDLLGYKSHSKRLVTIDEIMGIHDMPVESKPVPAASPCATQLNIWSVSNDNTVRN